MTLKIRNNGTWTEGRYRSFITSTIRGGFRRWPVKFAVLKNAFVGKKINPESGKLASFYKCACCRKTYTAKNVQVDHIAPIINPKVGFISWDSFIENLFCEEDNLQVLCIKCHKLKSAVERQSKKKKGDTDALDVE